MNRLRDVVLTAVKAGYTSGRPRPVYDNGAASVYEARKDAERLYILDNGRACLKHASRWEALDSRFQGIAERLNVDYPAGLPGRSSSMRDRVFKELLGKHEPGKHDQHSHAGTVKPYVPVKPSVYFHGTAEALVEKVLKEGLLPASMTGAGPWLGFAPQDEHEAFRQSQVFMAEDEHSAVEWGEYALGLLPEDAQATAKIAVFEIELPGDVPVQPDDMATYAWMADSVVKPEWIKGYKVWSPTSRDENGDFLAHPEVVSEVRLHKARRLFIPIVIDGKPD